MSGGSARTVASAAKLIFGRARSISSPPPPTIDLVESRQRAVSPSPLSPEPFREPGGPAVTGGRLVEPTSPTDSVTSTAMEPNSFPPQARLYPAAWNSSSPSLARPSPQSSRRSSLDIPSSPTTPTFPTAAVRTLCNRGSAIVSVHLSEPVLYLTGFEPQEYTERSPAILRGSLILKLLKPAKIKSITLTFKGRARTDWPEGIPPKKMVFFEEKELMTRAWTFFNARFTSSHGGNAAKIVESQRASTDISRTSMDSVTSLALSDTPPVRSSTPSAIPDLANSAKNHALPNGGQALFGIPFGQSQSVLTEEKTSTQARGYQTFPAGEYMYNPQIDCIDDRYNFELPIDSVLPESIECDMGSVRYELEADIERAGAFKSNLTGKTEILLVRNPAEQNLEIHEPISISRTWEDQLHYEILISGKAFPLNSTIPIAFKFTPLAKVRLHGIKVFLTENIEYFCRDKKVHRLGPMRKLMLFEKRARKSSSQEDTPASPTSPPISSAPSLSRETLFHQSSGIGVSGSRAPPPAAIFTAGNPLRGAVNLSRLGRPGPVRRQSSSRDVSAHSLLGNLEGGDGSGTSTEFEVDIPLPGCESVRSRLDTENKTAPLVPVRFHHTTIWSNIVVHHWIKIVMRLSKADENSENKSKRRHFEISIDSPIHLLSCRSYANIYLPAYTNPSSSPTPSCDLGDCPCRASLITAINQACSPTAANLPSQPSPLHLHRPLHLMRQPSINPPSFYDDVAPPLLTPPPDYDDLTPRMEVRDGYFDMDSNESNSDANTDRATEDNASDHATETDASSIRLHEDIEEEPESSQTVAPPLEEPLEEDSDDEGEIEDDSIVDMVGLEDLSAGMRASSPPGRRSIDFHYSAGGVWAS